MKKTFQLFLVFLLIFNTTLINVQASAIVGTPIIANGLPGSNVDCTETGTEEFYPLGDLRGNNVLTKKEISRECLVTKKEYGKCIKWEEKEQFLALAPSNYNSYESNNYSDALGSLLSAIGAYDQLEHLWSGWHGYCEIGTKSNFDWAEDPMFWASMAMSLLMSGSKGDGFLKGTTVGNFVNSTTESIGRSMGSLFEGAGSNFLSEAAESQAMDVLANTSLTFDQAVSAFYESLGRCMVNAGWSVTQSLYEFNQDDDDSFECDPVDEICDNTTSVTDESNIITMDETQFNDLTEQFANESPSLNIYDYVVILEPSPNNGIISLRMKNLNEMENYSEQDMEGLTELQEQMKSINLAINLGSTALSLSSCISDTLGGPGMSNSPGNASGTDEDRASVRKLGGAAIDFAGKFMGPYGAVFSAILKIALFVATSFQSIDSCYNEEDAQEQGKREERTQAALSFDLCHLVEIECAEKDFFSGIFGGDKCALDAYRYCCYDQVMSKILVEQLKAQLGRDWKHCTGITLRDLNYISFQQCTESQMNDSSTIDGAHQVGVYDYKKAFQYKYKCIDMTEFKDYLNTLLGEQIDMDDFQDFWNDITEQSPGVM